MARNIGNVLTAMKDNDINHEDLVEQAEKVLSAVEGSMYYPVAHGEAEELQNMIEEMANDNKQD